MSQHEPTEGDEQQSQVRPLRFLTMPQVADELASTPTVIRGLIRTGELPAIQVGGRGQWRIERVRLEKYIAGAYTKARTETASGSTDLSSGDA